MSTEHYHFSESDAEHGKELESRAAFKGLLDHIGVDIMQMALDKANEAQEKGQRGFTMPSEDHSVMVTVDPYNVHFSVEGFRHYSVPIDTATAAIAEVRAEQTPAGQ
jgi:hypothetical protein